MSRTLTLEIPETTFVVIEEQAQHKGIDPSELAVEWLSDAVQRIQSYEPDPLDALVGTLDVSITDVAERHDEYLGKAILEEIRRRPF